MQFESMQEAVFNGHVNDAGRKAYKACVRKYGRSKSMLLLRRLRRTGIMAMFSYPPKGALLEYATRVFAATNGISVKKARALHAKKA